MKHLKNLLVIVDPTATIHPAVDKAAALAAECNARVELFICDPEPASGEDRPASESQSREEDVQMTAHRMTAHRKMLELLAHPLQRSGLDVIVDVSVAKPLYAGILNKISESHPDLVVKDTHAHALANRTLFTNTDWQLIRCSPAPLLLVKRTDWTTFPVVVAAIDPGHYADKPAALDCEILEWAETLSNRLHGSLHAVHARAPSKPGAQEESSTLSSSAEDDIRSLLWSCPLQKGNLHLVAGRPADVLPAEATQLKASIIVVGAISRGAIKRAFIGNTAEKVLDRLPCDVLIIKPFDFSGDLPF